MGGGRKKNEKDTSFKRSDSFKRISIRKNYLDRGKKKKEQCLKEDNAKVDKDDKIENIYMKSPCNRQDKDDFCERSSVVKDTAQLQRFINSRDVCTQTEDDKDDTRPETDPDDKKRKVIPEKIIIHVPALEDMPKPLDEIKPPMHSVPFDNSRCESVTNLKRQESNDSAVEMFPWGESIEILKLDRSPVFRRNNFSPPSLMPESVSEEMCSLSVSLGRIWMDAPLAMSPRSLDLSTSQITDVRTAHNSLDSALKGNKDDPIVVNGLQKKNKPRKSNAEQIARTSSSSTRTSDTKTISSNDYPYIFSSKDSGFSFSASIPKLNECMPLVEPKSSGFFKMSKKKPKISAAKDEYLKRSCVMDGKFNPVFRNSSRSYKELRNSIKMRKRTKKENSKNDIYTVVVRRPPRSSKLDPMMFAPPGKEELSSDPCDVKELRDYSSPIDERTSLLNDYDSEDDFYERISPDYKDFDVYETVQSDMLKFAEEDEKCFSADEAATSCDDFSTLSISIVNAGKSSLYVKNQPRKIHFSGRRRKNSHLCKRRVIHLKNSDFFDVDAVEGSHSDDVEDDMEDEKDEVDEKKKPRQVVRRRRSRARRFVSVGKCKSQIDIKKKNRF